MINRVAIFLRILFIIGLSNTGLNISSKSPRSSSDSAPASKNFASAELESDRASNRLALRRGGGAFSSSSNPWECFDEKDALRSFVSTFAFSGTLHYSHHFAVDYDGVHDAH